MNYLSEVNPRLTLTSHRKFLPLRPQRSAGVFPLLPRHGEMYRELEGKTLSLNSDILPLYFCIFVSYSLLSFSTFSFVFVTLTVLFLFLGASIVCVSNTIYRGQQIVL